MSCADYAQLLKTLCLQSREFIMREFVTVEGLCGALTRPDCWTNLLKISSHAARAATLAAEGLA
jgi:hypothetical protein